MKIKTFRDLIVWQRSMDLARALYRETEQMPSSEMFGLTSQMRRAATSVPMNIAEGLGRHTRPEFLHGLRIAMGSLLELMTAYELATSMGQIKPSERVLELLAETDRVLNALIRSLKTKSQKERRSRKA